MQERIRERRKTKKEKIQEGVAKVPSKSFNDSYGYKKITLTDCQKVCSNKVTENDLTFVIGSSGSGKTMTVLYNFVQEYLRDPTKQIIIIRTPVEAGGDKIGFLTGSESEKLSVHFESTKIILEELLSKGKVQSDLGTRIHFKIPNFVLGSTFNNSLILIDEVQQLQPLILKLLLERVGLNSKVAVLGDSSQLYVDAKGRNALRDALPRFFERDYTPKYKNIGLHEFTVEDVVRSELTKTVIRAYS